MGALRIYRKTLPAKWEKVRLIGFDLLCEAQTNGELKEVDSIHTMCNVVDAIPDVALIEADGSAPVGYVLLIKINNDIIMRRVWSLRSTQHSGSIAPGHWIAKLCDGAQTAEEVFAYITILRMRGETL